MLLWGLVISAGLLCLQFLVSMGARRAMSAWESCRAKLPEDLGTVVLLRKVASSTFESFQLKIRYEFRAEVRSRGHGRGSFDLGQRELPIEFFLIKDARKTYVQLGYGPGVDLDNPKVTIPGLVGGWRIGVFSENDKGGLVFVRD